MYFLRANARNVYVFAFCVCLCTSQQALYSMYSTKNAAHKFLAVELCPGNTQRAGKFREHAHEQQGEILNCKCVSVCGECSSREPNFGCAVITLHIRRGTS